MRKPKPTVTADTPSGSITPRSSHVRVCRPPIAIAASPPIDRRDDGGDHREHAASCRSPRPAGRTARCVSVDVELAVPRRGRARRAPRSDRSTSTSERKPEQDRHHREVARRAARAGRVVRGATLASSRRRIRRGIAAPRLQPAGDDRAARRRRRAARAPARPRPGGRAAARSGGRSRSRASRAAGRRAGGSRRTT